MRYGNSNHIPRLSLCESFYICHSNLLFIRHPDELIKHANENVCVCHQGYLAVSASLFLFAGLVPSSLGVILRTTDKIVWANEFECELLERHSNLFWQSNVCFLLILEAATCSHTVCFLHSHRADLFNRVYLHKQPQDRVEKDQERNPQLRVLSEQDIR